MGVSHSGFVAIVGRPNVGKSTLLNALLGEKLAIVSPKPQTTRNRVTGVLTKESTQIIFLDTPGLHRAKTKLGEYMVKQVNESIGEVDAALLVIEPLQTVSPAEEELLQKLRAMKVPVILVVNKTDTLNKNNQADQDKLIGVIGAWSERFPFTAVVPLSARLSDGVEALLGELTALMPEGPAYYPEDLYTTEPERAIVAEIIREKLLQLMSQEIPHGTAVSVESFKERGNGSGDGEADIADIVDIEATIYCEKDSHKGMIIGKGGQMLKKVGTLARGDIERMLDCRVNLKLWVKVKEDWRNRSNVLKTLGYD